MNELTGGLPPGPPPVPEPATTTGGGSRTRRRAAAIVIVLLLAGSLGSWYLVYGSVSTETESLGQGRRYIDLPLMAAYSPPPDPAVDFQVAIRFGPGSSITYRWSAPEVNGTPVEFVLLPSASADSAMPNAFRWTITSPGNSITYGSNGTGERIQIGTVRAAAIDYVVKRVTVSSVLSSRTWLRVEYSIAASGVWLAPIPIRNVTLPEASDLLEAGVERSGAAGSNWMITWSLRDFALSPGPFRASVPPVAFDGGRYGTVTGNLTSERVWGANDDYVIEARGSGDVRFDFTWFWDMRFGPLLSA